MQAISNSVIENILTSIFAVSTGPSRKVVIPDRQLLRILYRERVSSGHFIGIILLSYKLMRYDSLPCLSCETCPVRCVS